MKKKKFLMKILSYLYKLEIYGMRGEKTGERRLYNLAYKKLGREYDEKEMWKFLKDIENIEFKVHYSINS